MRTGVTPCLPGPYTSWPYLQVWLLAVVAGIVPLVIILLTAALISRSFWDAHHGVLGLALSLGLVTTFTDIIKVRRLVVGLCAKPAADDAMAVADHRGSSPA